MLIFLTLCSMFAATTPPPSPVDTPVSTPDRNNVEVVPTEMHIVMLANARCVDVRETLRGMFGQATAWCDERTNSLICRAPKSQWDQILNLIKELDKPGGDPAKNELVMLPVTGRSAEEIARRISEVLGSRSEFRNSRIAADAQRSMLLLSGPAHFLEQAGLIAKQLDTPARTIRLEFTLLHAYQQPADVSGAQTLAEAAVELPGDLASVGKEVERFGIVRLLGRLGTVAVEGEKFAIAGDIAQIVECEIKGRLSMVSGNGQMRLELSAHLRRHGPTIGSTQPAREVRQRLFDLETSLSLAAGQTIILGTAPTGWSPGESAILVIRAME